MFESTIKKSILFNLIILIVIVLFNNTIFGQPRVEGFYLNPTTSAEVNRSISILPASFGDMTILVGTNKGKLMIAKTRSGEAISNSLSFKQLSFAPPSNELVREIYFDGNYSYALKNNGIYSNDTKSNVWLKKSLIEDLPQLPGATAEIWSMSFVNNRKVCVAGVYLKNNSDRSIAGELLVCSDNITDNFPQWTFVQTPENRKFDQLQLTNIYFDNNQNGWLAGTDGDAGVIWYSTDRGKSWEELDSEINEPLLSISGNGNNLFSVGYNGILLSNLPTLNNPKTTNKNPEIKKGTKVEVIVGFLQRLPFLADSKKIEKVIGKVVEIKPNKKLKLEIIEVEPKVVKNRVKTYYEQNEIDQSQVRVLDDETEDSSNYNSSWHSIDLSRKLTNPSTTLRSIKFAGNGLDGFIVGDKGTILYTSDGGKNWNPVKPLPPQLNSVDFYSLYINDGYCWVTGSKNAVVRINYKN